MAEQVRHRIGRFLDREGAAPTPPERATEGFGVLRMAAANLLLLTGVASTLSALARDRSWGAERDAPARPLSLAPAVLGPAAAVAHLAQVARPSPSASVAAHLFDSAAVGAGTVELLRSLRSARRTGAAPSLLPLALASAGVLGLLLEQREREVLEERRRLERRASVVERLVPRRRARLDHVVLHV